MQLPVRAPFACVAPWKLEPLIEGAIQGTLGLPVPVPQPKHRPPGTRLPERLVLEVADDEVHILDEGGERMVESWPRGQVAARVRLLDDVEVVLELRWSGVDRYGRIEAEPTDAAVAVAELLAHDTRVANGGDAETDAALMRLAEQTLPDELGRARHAALRAVAALVAPGERPLVVAGGERGWSFGIVVLTDRTLYWWSGGRKPPVVLARGEIAEAATRRYGDYVDLVVKDGRGRTTVVEVTPPERAEAIAELLAAELPEPAAPGLAALVAADPDEPLTHQLRRELELVAELWDDDEQGRVLAIGFIGAKRGALVLTDRRLLWASRKAEPIAIERSTIVAAELSRKLGTTRLDLTLSGGATQRFDAVDSRERAEAIRDALAA
jgi:hypothetical protein